MKIAIHDRHGSFSDNWIKYCIEKNIQYKIVNCYDNNIISQLKDCNGLMWHWDLNDYKAALFARQLTLSLEKRGIKVFPDFKTSWHYNDKVGQKYLLEAINAPLVKSYVFYSKRDALEWIKKTTFPKVFKLRSGASSSNVKLVKSKHQAKQLVKRAFGKGFCTVNPIGRIKQRIYKFKLKKNLTSIHSLLGGIARFFIPTELEKYAQKEKGYIYFQDFIPDNQYDFRIQVVGDYCWGFLRAVRENDFRASGSGIQMFDLKLFPSEIISTAFNLASKLNLQSVAFDFVLNQNKQPLLLELSYCFGFDNEDVTYGYWTPDLVFHQTEFNPFNEMVNGFIKSIKQSS